MFLTRMPSTESSPKDVLDDRVGKEGDLGVVIALWSMIFDARKSSRRWIRRTPPAYLARKTASSIAVSPPPTTATFLLLEEEPVAGGAPAHAAAHEALLTLQPSHLALAPVAMTTGSGEVGSSSPSAQSLNGRSEKSTLSTLSGAHLGPEAGGLGLEVVHHVRAHHAVPVAEVVLDVGGEHELPAGLEALEDQDVKVRPRSVQSRRVPRGPDPTITTSYTL